MRERDAQAREIMKEIRNVLIENWDPIGLKHEPEAQGEYDSYVGGVYRLLASGATAAQVAEHLRDLEAYRIGFVHVSAESLLPVAKKLLRLDVRLRGGSVA